jgi:hypothetical protein
VALLRAGQRAQALECFQKCVDVTPEMAGQLLAACRAAGVECIVAPYEADAQLAHLSRTGYVDVRAAAGGARAGQSGRAADLRAGGGDRGLGPDCV